MRNSQPRPVELAKRVEWLEQRHARLKEEVAELGGRTYLTPNEEISLRNLKKEKLHTKDTLEAARRDLRATSEGDLVRAGPFPA